jgi:broad specificity phosphatase PhoE
LGEDRGGEGKRIVRIYLVRHGRTALNARGVLRGHLDPPLDDVGQAEAQRLATALSDLGITMVVASPLRRAQETALAVAGAAGLEVEVDEGLIDRDYAGWAGHRREDLLERFGSLDAAPGVERSGAVRERAIDALYRVVRRAPGAAVVVSHDAVIRLLLNTLDPELGSADEIVQETGCFNEIAREHDSWAVLRTNVVPPESPAAAEIGCST